MLIGDVCRTTGRKILTTPDINNDGFKDQISQFICDGQPGYISAALTNPQKPEQLIGLGQWCIGTWPCLKDGLRQYGYDGSYYSEEKSNFANDPIRVAVMSNMHAVFFGLSDTVSYSRECTWNDLDQVIDQSVAGTQHLTCTTTGEIREFVFMIDETAARLVKSGVHLKGSDTFIPMDELTLVKSADPARIEVRDTARALIDTLHQEMGKSLARHAEILGYACRDDLYAPLQTELKQIETAVSDKLKTHLGSADFVTWNPTTRRYVFNMVINQLEFPPQSY